MTDMLPLDALTDERLAEIQRHSAHAIIFQGGPNGVSPVEIQKIATLAQERAELLQEVLRLRANVNSYQLCPKCRGQKHVATPPWVAGDLPTYSASDTKLHTCPVCAGAGVIERPTPRADTAAQ